MATDIQQEAQQYLQVLKPSSKMPSSATNEIQPSIQYDDTAAASGVKKEARPQSSDVLERARAALASAERASAAARAASELVNVKFGSSKLEGRTS